MSILDFTRSISLLRAFVMNESIPQEDKDNFESAANVLLNLTGSDAAAPELAAENEKLKAEIVYLRGALEAVIRNDKTRYGYEGKDALRADGSVCATGRFTTPREIAEAALKGETK